MPQKIRIIYLTNARLPTEKAHGLATVKLCEALADQGAEVMIVAPRRLNPLKADLYDYYRSKKNFSVRFLPTLDLLWLGFGQRLFFLVQLSSFSVVAALWLWRRYGSAGLRDVIIFSHDHVPLFFASLLFASLLAPKIFYDIHHYPENTVWYRRVLKKAKALGVQTRWKVSKLAEDFGVSAERVIYWPNGTDVERFDIALGKEEARGKLKLPQDKKIALYAGSLQKWKGVETFVAAAEFLPADILVYVVGGSKAEVANSQFSIFNFQTRNIVFVGQKPWAEISVWLKAADVLVLPNTGREDVALFYTSPMKLFEYMASGRPIVASDIPSIREVVDETMVFFAEADDPHSFANTIHRALYNPDEASRRAERARQEVGKYTWLARARKILDVLS